MGVIRKGENWFIDYRFQGRRIREKAGMNRARAELALAKRKTEMLEGRFFRKKDEQTVRFGEFAETYWELHGRHKRADSYESMLRFLVAAFGEERLGQITVPMILKYRNEVMERSSAANANRHHALLRSILNKAIEWEKLAGPNPAAKIKQQRENNHRLRFLSEEEIARLLYICHPRVFPVVACALLTGMRKGEILGLRWENIDIERGTLYVLESKSGKPREIPISPKLAVVLGKLTPAAEGPVFEVPEITLRRAFSRALKDAKIEGFRFHDLRHTFASHYVMRTGDLPSLQKLLGHHSPMMTQRYAHLASSHLRQGMLRFDSGMDTFWTPRSFLESKPVEGEPAKTQTVPTELLKFGAVAQGLERAFHKR